MQCLSDYILIAGIWSLGDRHSGQNSHFSQNALSHAAVELSSRVGKQFLIIYAVALTVST